jgi:undecaprenyl-diphosphatase
MTKIIKFIKNRFDTNKQTGLYLTIGATVAAVLIYIFINIIKDLFEEYMLLSFDVRILDIIKNYRTPSLTKLMLFITYLGEWGSIAILCFSILVILFLLQNWEYFYSLLISVIFGETFVYTIKNIIGRPRPPAAVALMTITDYSFPSGHSYIAVAFYGLITYITFKILKNKFLKYLTLVLGIILILSLSFSRLYLGVHWPSDILASFASSAALITIIITFLEIREKFYPNNRFLQQKAIKKAFIFSTIAFPLYIVYLIIFYIRNPII